MGRVYFHGLASAAGYALILLSLSSCGTGPIPAASTAKEPASGYARADYWLCRPGRQDACAANLSATVIRPNHNSDVEMVRADPDAPIDCFYIYPTVSMDESGNSDMSPGAEERRAVQQQFARFGSQCRLFAPVYRQLTIPALRSRVSSTPMQMDPKLAYDDVRNAWNDYLRHDNKGRGVVLIGHSQGARMLSELISREIEGKPVQKKIISALLIGTNITVPKGKDVGGSFHHMPLCTSASQTGCVIAYVSFRAGSPPPANSLFGRADGDGMVACTNPAALAGGRGDLRPYLTTKFNLIGQPLKREPWARQVQDIRTPFVSAPGLLSAQCVTDDNASYLAVTRDPAQANAGVDIAGDLIFAGKLLPEWGLHLVDMDIAMGNLIDIVGQQAKAYLSAAN